MNAARLALIVATVCTATSAHAHKPSDSFLKLTADGEQLGVRWDISLRDLDFVIGVDGNGDGDVVWGEVLQRRDAICEYVLPKLRIDSAGQECRLELQNLMAIDHSDGGYVVLQLAGRRPRSAGALRMRYELFFDVDPTHRGLLLDERSTANSYVFSAESRTIELDANDAGLSSAFLMFVEEGLWHIWLGFDHLLFLAALLLPGVWERRESRWEPTASFSRTCAAVARVVTMFTLAHSITLWLAVTHLVSLPSQWIESAIALSIVVTAANNLRPTLPFSNCGIAFAFGLVHGFGFANVLNDLGLEQGSLAVSLVGFNIGVELGQLAIVAAFLPLAFCLRNTHFYQQVMFRLGSAIVGLFGVAWSIERMFNVRVFGA